MTIPVMLPDRHTEVRLTRAEFEAMIRPALEETVVALRRAVASAELGVDDVAAVLLVGGSSRIPLVGQLVAAELGRPIAVDARPKDAIASGAALVAMVRRRRRARADPATAGAPVPVVADPPSPSPGAPAGAPPAPPRRGSRRLPGCRSPPRAPTRPPTGRRRSAAAWRSPSAPSSSWPRRLAACVLARDDGDDRRRRPRRPPRPPVPRRRPRPSARRARPTAQARSRRRCRATTGATDARTRSWVTARPDLGDELSLAGDPATACACIYDAASTDAEWTSPSFNERLDDADIDDVDGAVVRRFGNLIVDCGAPG